MKRWKQTIMSKICIMIMYTSKTVYKLNQKSFTYHSVSCDGFRIVQTMKLMTSNDRNSKLKSIIIRKTNIVSMTFIIIMY